ncbi:MAG: hypothetical protein U0326_11965 [Polyangiales bacterium]
MRRLTVLSLALCLPTTALAQPAAGDVTLRYHYTVGARQPYTARVGIHSTTEIQSVTVTTGNVETVSVDADGAAQMQLRVTRVALEAPSVGALNMQAVANDLRGASVRYRMTARGELTDLRVEGEMPPGSRAILEDVIEAVGGANPVLPENPVRVGATWTRARTFHSANVSATQDLQVSASYTLRSLTGDGAAQVAVVAVDEAYTLPPTTLPRDVRLSGEGAVRGEATLALGRGRVAASQAAGDLTLHIVTPQRSRDGVLHMVRAATGADAATRGRRPR